MKILILCDHYPISPRVKKVRNSILKLYPESIVKVFAWNRGNSKVTEDYIISYDQKLGYGNKFKKMLNIFNYIKSARKFILEFKPTYIHAIDIEMLIASILIKSKATIIYEVYDIKSFKNNILNKMREKIEFELIKGYRISTILASPFFACYYEENGIKNLNHIVLNNKPSRSSNIDNSKYMDMYKAKLKNKIIVGFIGTIRYEEILKNLINSSKKLENIVIVFAGNGPSYESIKSYVIKSNLQDKVVITGRYESKDLDEIYKSCDYIWAAYPNKSLNVKYAISNKFFESIVFNKKIIVSKLTMLGDYVKKKNIGYTVDPYNVEEITALLESLHKYSTSDNKIIIENGLNWEDEEGRLINIYHDHNKITKR